MNVFLIGEAANHAATLARHLQAPAELVALPREAASSDAFDARIRPGDVVVSLRFSRSAGAPPFRLLHVPGAGLDGIDMASLPPSCSVCNVFEHEIPIAEFVSLAMLEWQIRLRAMTTQFSGAAWSDSYRNRQPHGELFGQTLALIGLGRIGQAIAQRARAFGMRIIALDEFAQAPPGLVDQLLPPQALDEVLPQADFVAISCPLTRGTRGMFNADTLGRMKDSAVLINISRAEIADEDDLYAALRDKRIGGAVMDVWYRYPQGNTDQVEPSAHAFHALPNVLATPHSSAWTVNLPQRRYAFLAANIGRLVRGEPLLNLVRRGVTPV